MGRSCGWGNAVQVPCLAPPAQIRIFGCARTLSSSPLPPEGRAALAGPHPPLTLHGSEMVPSGACPLPRGALRSCPAQLHGRDQPEGVGGKGETLFSQSEQSGAYSLEWFLQSLLPRACWHLEISALPG
ncbi:hypothetical protein DR999_PMT16949 [Platysternon megacephalum]|uniref:Uncharacterized protein n=1 Tax=Platysternon megacephalum TaxID=55544 RepID=A0A4D9E0M6_9SAUR|nr:hypothetical protein DR999_PMT16949 [Platysternon megacephalum]